MVKKNIVLAVSCIAFGSTVLADGTIKTVKTDAPTFDLSIRYVDTYAVMGQSEEGKKIGQQVEAKRNKAVAKLKEKEQEYVDAAKEFKAKAATMSEDARIKAQKKLTKMERTYKADLQEIEEELKIAMHQAQEKLVREHNDAVYEYARANNVDIVFGPGGVVYASEKAKCTGDVVKNMNKNYSQKLARAKGKKAATTVASKTVKKPLVKA